MGYTFQYNFVNFFYKFIICDPVTNGPQLEYEKITCPAKFFPLILAVIILHIKLNILHYLHVECM